MPINMYMDDNELSSLGLKYCGKNVKISKLAIIHNPELTEIGDNTRIDNFCVLTGRVKLGNHVHLSLFTYIGGGKDGVTLENYCTCAYHCTIITATDDYSLSALTSATVPDEYKNVSYGPVLMKKYSILGAYSLVMPGVVINEGCSFGAYSFVNKSTDAWTMYAGVPIKRLRENSKECVQKAAQLEKM